MQNNLYMDSMDFEECIDWNPHSNYEEDNLHIPQYNLPQSNAQEGEKKKPSHKNKYINKITQIKPESTSNSKRKCPVDRQASLEPEELKKFKNRQAAKQSRQRKKLYINLMEEQIKKLESELAATNKSIESCKSQIHKNTFNNNQSIGSFDLKQAHVFKKIERLLESDESEERNSEINLAIDSILYRYGATGKERKNNINQTYKLILLLAFPVIHRYIAWSAKEKAHLFLTNQSFNLDYEAWFAEIRQAISDQIEGKEAILAAKREQITHTLQQLQSLSANLIKGKRQIQSFGSFLDTVITEIRQILTPAQSAKLVIFIEQYKFREQIRFLEMVVNPSPKAEGQPRKYVKLESQSMSQFQ